ETRKMQYLYNSADEYTFMDQESFEQLTLPGTKLERELNFLQENMTVSIMLYQGETIGIDLPNSVTLEVTETEPAVKGDTAQGATKVAILETGFSVQVPFFINIGDKLIIDTRTGDYVSRA
ncbi:MAG: elongation factor P, partial [Bacilli bacterium]